MKVTLLGSGDPLGMPIPLCGCEYCENSDRRRSPALLIEDEDLNLVFDVGPNILDQLSKSGITSLDSIFVTHTHNDHFGGFPDLHNLKMIEEFEVYGSNDVKKYKQDNLDWVNANINAVEDGETVVKEDLKVTGFPVNHSEVFKMQGFAIEKSGSKVVYVPDLKSLDEDYRDIYMEPDLLFVDGLYLFSRFLDDEDHASGDKLKSEIEKFNAERVVLTNVTEHWHEMSTEELKEATEYEIWNDFTSIEI